MVRSRDRIVGAVFVLAVVTAQARWMGSATTLLSVGLVVAYLFWITAHWKDDPAAVLPICLLAIAVQCLHFAEEYLTGFQRQFPRLVGYEWSDARFLKPTSSPASPSPKKIPASMRQPMGCLRILCAR